LPVCFMKECSRMTKVVKRYQVLWLLADLVMDD